MNPEAVRAMLAPLWNKNRSHILERLAHVRHALATDAEPTDEERSDLHALVGTLGTYGWPDGSDLVEEIRIHLITRAVSSDYTVSMERSGLLRKLDLFTARLAEA